MGLVPAAPLARILAISLTLVAFAACARGEPAAPSDEAGQQALQRVDELDEDLARVQEDLQTSIAEDRELARRLGKLSKRLDRRLRGLQDSLDGLRGAISAAAGDADSAADRARAAAARAEEIARELSVLSDRYDYHLRRYHGGK